MIWINRSRRNPGRASGLRGVRHPDVLGFGALRLTVDYSRRERDISKRNGRPRLSPRTTRYRRSLDRGQFGKLRARYKVPLIVKGVATVADARLAVEHGVGVIYVANHGGRQLDHA